MNSVFISFVQLLKGMKDTLIFFFMTCLFSLPYVFTSQTYLETHLGDLGANLILGVGFGLAAAAGLSLSGKANIFRMPLPIFSKLIVLSGIFVYTVVIIYTIKTYNTSFYFKEYVNFSQDYTISETFQVHKKNEYRFLFITENLQKFECCFNGIKEKKEKFVNINTNGDMALYEDEKLIWHFTLPTTYENYFSNEILDPVNLITLKPYKTYRFVTNIRKSEIQGNYHFHVSVRTAQHERRIEGLSMGGIFIFMMGYSFFSVCCLIIIFYDFIKSLFKKKLSKI